MDLNFTVFSDTELMAGLWYGEARLVERDPVDEIYEYLAIGSTVMNRVLLPMFPSTIQEVILAPMQFSCFNSDDPNAPMIWAFLRNGKEGRLPTLKERLLYQTLMTYSEQSVNKKTIDFSHSADHYVARYLYEKPSTANHPWIRKMKITAVHGGHVFLRSDGYDRILKQAVKLQ